MFIWAKLYFFFCILSCIICLHILNTNSLLVLFENIFSHSSRLSFHFVDGFLYINKCFKWSHLFFVSFAWGNKSKKLFLQFMSKNVLPMFSFRNFMVSSLTFRSLIHIEFIFLYGMRKCSDFILLHVAVQFLQHQEEPLSKNLTASLWQSHFSSSDFFKSKILFCLYHCDHKITNSS